MSLALKIRRAWWWLMDPDESTMEPMRRCSVCGGWCEGEICPTCDHLARAGKMVTAEVVAGTIAVLEMAASEFPRACRCPSTNGGGDCTACQVKVAVEATLAEWRKP